MHKGYKYSEYLNRGDNATERTQEFHELSHSDNRLNTFIIKDIDGSLQEFAIAKPQYSITINYPTEIQLRVNGVNLRYTMSNGNRVSTVSNIESDGGLQINIIPASGFQYVYDVAQSDRCISSLVNNKLALLNVTGDNTITIREQTNISSRVHFVCSDTTGISNLIINAVPIALTGTLDTYYDYPNNDYTAIEYQLSYEDGYMLNECKAFINNAYSEEATCQFDGTNYTLSLRHKSNNTLVTEYWVVFSAKPIPSNDYVVRFILNNPTHISYVSAHLSDLYDPTSAIYDVYVPRNKASIQVDVTAKTDYLITQRTVDGVATTVNYSSDGFILTFDATKYGEDNPYIVSYATQAVSATNNSIRLMGLNHATVQTEIQGGLDKTPVNDDYVSVYNLLINTSDSITITADAGYTISQDPYISSGSGSITNITYNADRSIITFDINAQSDITINLSVIIRRRHTIMITCPTNMDLSFSDGNLSVESYAGNYIYTLSAIGDNTSVQVTITCAYEYIYTVSGSCGYHINNSILTLETVQSDISITLAKKPNTTCAVVFVVEEDVSTLQIGGDVYNTTSFTAYSSALPEISQYNDLKSKVVVLNNINESTIVTIIPTFANGYELDRCWSMLPDGTALNNLYYDGTAYNLSFVQQNGEYPESVVVVVTAAEIVNTNHYIELHVTPNHLSYLNIESVDNTLLHEINSPSDSIYLLSVSDAYNSVIIDYAVDANKCSFVSLTLDGVSQPSGELTINLTGAGPDNPNVIIINTEAYHNEITIRLPSPTEAEYIDLNSPETFYRRTLPLTTSGNNKVAVIQLSRTLTSTLISLIYSGDYEVKGNGYELNAGNATITVDSSLSSMDNYDDDMLGVLVSIDDITSDLDLSLLIGLIETWLKADFYQLKWGTLGAGWTADEDGSYAYSRSISGSTITRSMCIEHHSNAKYRLVFADICPSIVWARTSDTLLSAPQTCNASNGYTQLSGVIIDAMNRTIEFDSGSVPENAAARYLYLGFSGFGESVMPIISDIAYCLLSDISTASNGTDGEYFSEDIIDLKIIQEVDITGSSIPYSSYTATIKDDRNSYNPIINAEEHKNKIYEIYSLVCDLSAYNVGLVLNPEYYVTKIATVRLDSVSAGNSTAILNLIGPIEYYDSIVIDDNELLLSSVTQKTNLKNYLLQLFHGDIDVSAFNDNMEITTPFESESKTQIAQIIAQAHAKYLAESSDGKICFRSFGDNARAMYNSSTPYKLSLDRQMTMPQYERVSTQYDSVRVNVYRHKIGARVSLDDYNTTLFVKCIKDSDIDTELDDGSNMIGYTTMVTIENGTEVYYDEEGNPLPNESSLNPIASKYHNLKYGLLRKYFGKKVDASTAFFIGNEIFGGDSHFKNIGEQSLNDLITNWAYLDHDNAGNKKNGGIRVTEDYVDVWFKIDHNNTFNYYGPTRIGDNDVEALLAYFAFSYSITGTPLVRPIESDILVYNYHPESTMSNTLVIDNPLVVTTRQAEILANYYYLIANLRIYDATSEWRGDCTIEPSDAILTAVSLGAGVQRTYDNYYDGIITKNDIDFNGGLTETTVVALPDRMLYEHDGQTSGSGVTIKLSAGTELPFVL